MQHVAIDVESYIEIRINNHILASGCAEIQHMRQEMLRQNLQNEYLDAFIQGCVQDSGNLQFTCVEYFHMNLDEYNKDVYAVDDKIYYVVNRMTVRDQNIAKFNFYMHSANQENPYVNNRISDCYFKGKGVEKDIDQALLYALKAESQGSTKGLFNIGLFYELKEDYENALAYYNKAKKDVLTNPN